MDEWGVGGGGGGLIRPATSCMVPNMTLGTLKLKKEQEKKKGWIGNGRKVDTAYRQQQLCSLRVKSNITQTYFNLLLDLAPINT